MAGIYNTPGVYIEEISKFPPSIAPVETAIPAFIGYTEKADKITPGDLINVPTKIGSFADYELLFGKGAAPEVTDVTLDDDKNFKSASVNNVFYMYDSLKLFYDNGGGDCYIVSTGVYESAGKTAAEFTDPGKGVSALEKVDEPTILVFPDNSLLTGGTDFYKVYQAALAQCGKLMDRVGLFHVKENDVNGTEFRSGTGVKDLKYGAAYSPWLAASFPKSIKYRDFKGVIKVGTTSFALSDLTDDSDIKNQISEFEKVMDDVDKIKAAANSLASPKNTLRERFKELESQYLSSKSAANFTKIIEFMFDIARKADTLVGSGASALDSELKSEVKSLVSSTFKALYSTLISHDKELDTDLSGYSAQFSTSPPTASEWGGIFAASAPAASSVVDDSASAQEQMDSMMPRLRTLFDRIVNAWLGSVAGAATELEKKKHEGLLESFPLYKSILTGLQHASANVPPSGAVAGIYAYVDRTRGVWKAPANVSISSIVGPSYNFTASELADLNVDPNSGKSINAIRSFTGKGTLVFGARTLAGNDNEWRYISVRRFFNFVEESSKKATEQFVFEPNDANTWVRVQAMIENFLTTLWRQGALQGMKPEHAFYVHVGLGKTMTALDILEGRMIVEIGLAVVRPAEFIILRFSHKMVES
jgi:hypothetical protein